LRRDVKTSLSLSMLAERVPTTTPIRIGSRQPGSAMTRMPAASPAAGQNTATPEDGLSIVSPKRAARKYPAATTLARHSARVRFVRFPKGGTYQPFESSRLQRLESAVEDSEIRDGRCCPIDKRCDRTVSDPAVRQRGTSPRGRHDLSSY